MKIIVTVATIKAAKKWQTNTQPPLLPTKIQS